MGNSGYGPTRGDMDLKRTRWSQRTSSTPVRSDNIAADITCRTRPVFLLFCVIEPS